MAMISTIAKAILATAAALAISVAIIGLIGMIYLLV